MKQEALSLNIIARIHTDFPTKFGLPRQSGLVEELRGQIVMEPEYRDASAFRGVEEYSHLWLIWQFSEAVRESWSPTVRPPRLGGNTRMGVFATRSPFRPNSLGLSSVRLERVEWGTPQGPILHVLGADLMDNTPILDIKPYLPYTDSHPEARGGFADTHQKDCIPVVFPPELLGLFPEPQRKAAVAVLEQDPRPGYQKDSREYGLAFAGFDIRFRVTEGILTVTGVISRDTHKNTGEEAL